MDINLTKETVDINKSICEKTETISVQGDMIVPDSKPDILNTISTCGNISIYKEEINDGKIRIDGNILTYIMYLSDENTDNIRGLNTSLDFSENINVAELQADMEVDLCAKVKSIECKVLNGRKINIKANVEINMKIHLKQTVDMITNMNDENIQVLNNHICVNSILGEGTTKSYVKENISISNNDNLAEILKAKIELVNKDIKISYNKVLAKAEIDVNITYLTEDGRIQNCRSRVPLVGFIDIVNIKEDNTCETSYMIKNIIIKPNTVEEHSVYIEVEAEINCIAYAIHDVKIIEDMYCPGERMNFETNNLNTTFTRNSKQNVCNIMEKMNISELENGNIVDIETNVIINKENRLSGRIVYEGELEIEFMYTESTSIINTKKITIPFEQAIEGIENNERAESVIEVDSKGITNNSGIVTINVDLIFNTSFSADMTIPVISNITTDPMEDLEDYSIIIYVVRKDDTLWKIAKRFGSTVDDIVRVNGIENPNKINAGEKLYIPKYVLKKAKEPIVLKQNV